MSTDEILNLKRNSDYLFVYCMCKSERYAYPHLNARSTCELLLVLNLTIKKADNHSSAFYRLKNLKNYFECTILAFGNFFLSEELIRAAPKGLSLANSINIGAATKIEE